MTFHWRAAARIACAVAALVLVPAVALATPIYWVDWQTGVTDAAGGFTATGTITTPTSTVTVTYYNPQGVSFFQNGSGGGDFWANKSGGRNDAISPYTSSTVDNAPTGNDIIALRYAGNQTLTFSQSVGNPVFAYVSLNGNGYEFVNQDFTILSQGGVDGNDCGFWGCGDVSKVVQTSGPDTLYELNANGINGGEPHGTIEFQGAFNSLDWISESNENWNGFTVGVQGTADDVFSSESITPVPEPATLLLLGTGVATVARRIRRR